MKLRKLGAAFMAGVLSVSMLVGCGSVTAEGLLKKAEEKSSGAKYTEAVSTVNMEMNISGNGQNLTIPYDVTVAMKSDTDKNVLLDVNVKASMLGQSVDENMSVYVTGGKTYMKSTESSDEWEETDSLPEDTLDSFEKQTDLFDGIDTSAASLGEEEDVDGVKAYKVTIPITGDYLKTAIENNTSNLSDMLGTEINMDDVDFSQSNTTAEYWITKDGDVVKYHMDLASAMNTLMDTMLSDALKESMGGDVTLSFTKLETTISGIHYDNNGSVKAPEDFKAE